VPSDHDVDARRAAAACDLAESGARIDMVALTNDLDAPLPALINRAGYVCPEAYDSRLTERRRRHHPHHQRRRRSRRTSTFA